jgi:hypothetical protein
MPSMAASLDPVQPSDASCEKVAGSVRLTEVSTEATPVIHESASQLAGD